VDTVGQNKKATEEYIRNQLQEYITTDQISLKEYINLFTEKRQPLKRLPEKEMRLANRFDVP